MEDFKKPAIKSAKAQKLILELEDLFDPNLFDFKKSIFAERFHGKLVVSGDACDLPIIKQGFMPFALICKDEIRWGSKLMVMESKPNIPEFLGVYVLCFIHEGLWWEQRVKDAFKPGKTVEFIGGWGRFVEWSKMKGRFFVFSLVALI